MHPRTCFWRVCWLKLVGFHEKKLNIAHFSATTLSLQTCFERHLSMTTDRVKGMWSSIFAWLSGLQWRHKCYLWLFFTCHFLIHLCNEQSFKINPVASAEQHRSGGGADESSWTVSRYQTRILRSLFSSNLWHVPGRWAHPEFGRSRTEATRLGAPHNATIVFTLTHPRCTVAKSSAGSN